MAETVALDLEPSQDTLVGNLYARNELNYVGREIWMGAAGHRLLELCAISGRSNSSRQREYQVSDQEVVRTVAPGKTEAEMREVRDADLIYYTTMQELTGVHVVSNGAQTPYVAGRIVQKDYSLERAVRSAPKVRRDDGTWVDLSSYEPDELTTPRITGVINLWNEACTPFGLCIVRRAPNSYGIVYASWKAPSLDILPDGVAYGIRTYRGEGGSTESFDDKEPYALPLPDTAEETADMYIAHTDPENLVAVSVKEIDRRTGEVRFVIRNDLQSAA